MSDENLKKEVFDVHMEYTRKALEELKSNTSLVFHRLDEQNKTLVRNTLSLEEHKKRSLHIEERQEGVLKNLNDMSDTLMSINSAMELFDNRLNHIESEIKPIQTHVVKVRNLTSFLEIMYNNRKLIVKIIIVMVGLVSSIYLGIENGIGVFK